MLTPISNRPLRALRSRDFRLYFVGQLVSLTGTWMQQIAMGWLIYRLTDSALALGLLGFANQIPILLFGAVGGVWSDRLDRRRLMMWTQALALAQATLLAVLTWQGWVTPAVLLALALLMGFINALDMPVRQSLVVHLVDDRRDLPNAIALGSLLMNATRFIGPALAGFVIAHAGEAVCFAFNAASYLGVLLALGAIRARPAAGTAQPALGALREGLAYTFGHANIRLFLWLVAAASLLITPYVVLMPMYAKAIFAGDARTLGLLVGTAGAGSLLASLYLASRHSIDGLPRQVSLAARTAGLALALFAVNPHQALAYAILMALGFSVVLVAAGSNTLLQTWVRDDLRGRVMATFSMAFLGVAPLGSLAVGNLAHYFGVRPVLLACGVLTIAVGFVHGILLRRALGTVQANA